MLPLSDQRLIEERHVSTDKKNQDPKTNDYLKDVEPDSDADRTCAGGRIDPAGHKRPEAALFGVKRPSGVGLQQVHAWLCL